MGSSEKGSTDSFKLYDGEFKFISVIWENEPVNSTELVRLCALKLGWKKSTTYTMLKRLSGRGLVCNSGSVVTSIVKREQVGQYETEALLDRLFGGSLPSFVAAFLGNRKLTPQEAEELEKMIREAQ